MLRRRKGYDDEGSRRRKTAAEERVKEEKWLRRGLRRGIKDVERHW